MDLQPLTSLIAGHPFCQGMREDDLALITGCAANRRYAPGELLFRAGDQAAHTWLLRQGRVSFEVAGPHGAVPLETAEEGELVGWAWLFPPYQYHFDARAVGVVRAFELDGACLRHKCEADPRFGYELTRRMLQAAHRRLERSRLQALDVYQRSGP